MASLEHEILEKVMHLSIDQKRKVLEFVDTREAFSEPRKYSARDLLQLPPEERNRLMTAAIELAVNEEFETFEAYSEESVDEST